jgi:hypothetical protein
MSIDVDFLVVFEVIRVPKRLRPVVAQSETVDTRCQTINIVLRDHVRY